MEHHGKGLPGIYQKGVRRANQSSSQGGRCVRHPASPGQIDLSARQVRQAPMCPRWAPCPILGGAVERFHLEGRHREVERSGGREMKKNSGAGTHRRIDERVPEDFPVICTPRFPQDQRGPSAAEGRDHVAGGSASGSPARPDPPGGDPDRGPVWLEALRAPRFALEGCRSEKGSPDNLPAFLTGTLGFLGIEARRSGDLILAIPRRIWARFRLAPRVRAPGGHRVIRSPCASSSGAGRGPP